MYINFLSIYFMQPYVYFLQADHVGWISYHYLQLGRPGMKTIG